MNLPRIPGHSCLNSFPSKAWELTYPHPLLPPLRFGSFAPSSVAERGRCVQTRMMFNKASSGRIEGGEVLLMADFNLSLDKLRPGMAAIVGIPLDENSSFMRGPALAPPRIRETVRSSSSNLSAENGLDLGTNPSWQDVGDLMLTSGPDAFAQIEQAIGMLLERDVRVLSLGGDHAITYPVIRAFASKYPRLRRKISPANHSAPGCASRPL